MHREHQDRKSSLNLSIEDSLSRANSTSSISCAELSVPISPVETEKISSCGAPVAISTNCNDSNAIDNGMDKDRSKNLHQTKNELVNSESNISESDNSDLESNECDIDPARKLPLWRKYVICALLTSCAFQV